MSTELVVNELDTPRALEVFTKREGIQGYKDSFKEDILSVVPDLSTDKGRKAVAANAFKANKAKAMFEKSAKALLAENKKIPDLIRATRTEMQEFFDDVAITAREPLTIWEAEQKKIADDLAIEAARVKLQAEVDSDHELAELQYAEYLRQAEADRVAEVKRLADEKIEQARLQKERDDAIALEAKKLAEDEAQDAIDKAEAKTKQAGIDKIAAEKKVKQDAIDDETKRVATAKQVEEDRIAAVQKAKRDAEQAVIDEQKRVAAEQKIIDDDAADREADTKHRTKVHKDILDFMVAGGIETKKAKGLINCMSKGDCPWTTINY